MIRSSKNRRDSMVITKFINEILKNQDYQIESFEIIFEESNKKKTVGVTFFENYCNEVLPGTYLDVEEFTPKKD